MLFLFEVQLLLQPMHFRLLLLIGSLIITTAEEILEKKIFPTYQKAIPIIIKAKKFSI
jgi:hypothetical protein